MGGAETLITNYALRINKQKFDILIVTVSKSRNTINEKKLDEAGIKIFYLGDMVVFSNASNIVKRIINKIHKHILLHTIINREKPDVVHTHLATNEYVASINTKRRNIKSFHTIHSDVNTMFKRKKHKMVTKKCIKHKGMIPIALHSDMQYDANALFNINSTLVMPNAINLSRFTNVEIERSETIKSLDINTDSFIIGHVGRFSEEKNHKFLIDVFASLKQKYKEAHLILVGTGGLENQLKEQVRHLGLQNNVSFLGNREDIPELMNAMDVFVFPSKYEGFGNVLIEAQAAGVRCVASDTIPKDAFVTNLVTTLSLNNTVESWVENILNSEYPANVKGNLTDYDINNVIKRLENIYLL